MTASPKPETLYSIESHLAALVDTIEGMSTDDPNREQAIQELQEYVSREISKVDGVAAYIAQCEMQENYATQEIERLKRRKAQWCNRRERVTGYVISVMQQLGKRTLEGRANTFTLRNNPPSVNITDETKIPEEYKRQTITIAVDKLKIRDAIKAGQEVPGADLNIGGVSLMRS